MINLELQEELAQYREMMHSVGESVFRPIARKYDIQEHDVPEELEFLRAAQKSTKKDKKEGEKPKSKKPSIANISSVLISEEMSWGDLGLMLSVPGQGLGNAAINAVGTPEQKEKFDSKYAAMAITEPGSGSDTASIQTTARLDGDEYVLNGEKIFVTAADRCDIVVVWASLDLSVGRPAIKSFIVEKGAPGFVLEYLEHKLGIRASDTGTFVLKDVRVPKENLLGNPDIKAKKGIEGVMQTFDNTRPMVAAMAVGVSRAVLEFTKEKIEENGITIDYRKNLNSMTSIEKEFYQMEANLDAMRLLIWRAAWLADNGVRNSLQASMSKAKAGKTGSMITQKCCELLGPLGYTQKHLVEKWMRDVKITDIFEGTGQIQHLIVARQTLKLTRHELK